MRVWVVWLFALLMVAIVAPETACAQNRGPGVNPSTGTLIAAAMETAGYATQGKILKDLKDLLENLAALIFLCCLISAIISAAVHGQFDMVRWFLIGPMIFFFLIKDAPSSAGVEWQFGIFDDGAKQKDVIMREAKVQQRADEPVSWFFHQYNKLISDIVQSSIRLFTNNKANSQMLFMTRQKITDELFSMEINDSGLLALVRFTMAQCGDQIEAARRIGFGLRHEQYRSTPEYVQAVALYCSDTERKALRQGLDNTTLDYVRKVLAPAAVIQGDWSMVAALQQGQTCAQLWRWGYYAIQLNATTTLGAIKKKVFQKQAPDYFADIYDRVFTDIVGKISRARAQTEGAANNDRTKGPCPNVSNRQAAAESAEAALPIIFAAWMMRKLYTNDYRGAMVSRLNEHAGLELQQNHYRELHSLEANQAKVRRWRNSRLAESAKWEAYTLAMLLPYVQGAGLFVLASVFPFFALLVIIPGRAGSFFMWCALWAWLKSWDVGWALVMIIDEALWSVMPHTTFFSMDSVNPGNGGGGFKLETDAVTVFEAAFEGDYAYNLSSYYMLIGGVISAVPVLTAHAVLGSKKAVAGIMINGLKTIGQSFGKAAGDWVATEQVGHEDRRREMSQFLGAQRMLERDFKSLLTARNRFNPGVENAAGMESLKSALGMGNPQDLAAAGAGMKWDPNGATPAAMGDPANRSLFSEFMTGRGTPTTGANGKVPLASPRGVLDFFSNPRDYNPTDLMGSPDRPNHLMLNDSIAHNRNMPDLLNPEQREWFAPTNELEVYRRRIESGRLEGQLLRSAGNSYLMSSTGLAGLGVAAKMLTLPGGDKLAHYLGGREAGYGLAMMEAGVKMERAANAHAANYLTLAASEYYYQISKERPALSAESRRAGASLRGEWWNVQEAPYFLMGDTLKAHQRLDSEFGFIKSKLFGDGLMGLLPPKRVAKQ